MIKDEVCWWAVIREMWAWSYDYAYCRSGMPPQVWEQKSVDGYLKCFPPHILIYGPSSPPMAGLACRCKDSSSSWDFAGSLLRPSHNSIKEPGHCVKTLIASLVYMRCWIWKRERRKFVEFQMPCVPSTHYTDNSEENMSFYSKDKTNGRPRWKSGFVGRSTSLF